MHCLYFLPVLFVSPVINQCSSQTVSGLYLRVSEARLVVGVLVLRVNRIIIWSFLFITGIHTFRFKHGSDPARNQQNELDGHYGPDELDSYQQKSSRTWMKSGYEINTIMCILVTLGYATSRYTIV
jgi:hypothetical protein